jgi:hypothetical protein
MLSLVGVLGDLADVCGEPVQTLYLQQPHFYLPFIDECLQTGDNAVLRSTALFAQSCISKLVGAGR